MRSNRFQSVQVGVSPSVVETATILTFIPIATTRPLARPFVTVELVKAMLIRSGNDATSSSATSFTFLVEALTSDSDVSRVPGVVRLLVVPLGIVVFCDWERFTREERLVRLKVDGIDETQVCWDNIT